MLRRDEASQAFARKLQLIARLDAEDLRAIEALPCQMEHVEAGRHLVKEGARPESCCLLVRGYACRYKVSINGAQQIVSFHVAGDMLDLQHLYLATADHNVKTITMGTVAWLPKEALQELVRQRPTVGEALWKDSLVDASVFREWVLNVGRRDAKERIAHMLCELVARASAAGLGPPHNFRIPLTQDHIADATGLTPVHVNRMMKLLVSEGLLEGQGRQYRVLDWAGLRREAGFNDAYLHSAAA